MIKKEFWLDVRTQWYSKQLANGGHNSSQVFDGEEEEGILFDDVDYKATVGSMTAGGGVVAKKKDEGKQIALSDILEEPEPAYVPPVPQKPEKKHIWDKKKYDELMDKRDLDSYVEMGKIIMNAGMDEDLCKDYVTICEKIMLIQENIKKYERFYKADMSEFTEMLIPECFELMLGYYEYEDAGASEELVSSTRQTVKETTERLSTALTEENDKLVKFAQIELKAQAKAIMALMGSAGFVDPDQKL